MKNNSSISSTLDDSGLNRGEFRIYCHVLRCGKCSESISAIAKHCRMSVKTVRRTIKILLDKGYIYKWDGNRNTLASYPI